VANGLRRGGNRTCEHEFDNELTNYMVHGGERLGRCEGESFTYLTYIAPTASLSCVFAISKTVVYTESVHMNFYFLFVVRWRPSWAGEAKRMSCHCGEPMLRREKKRDVLA
jgi:hypothetical protein